MKAEIIAIGSELLGPKKMDTNSLYLTEKLNRLGIQVVRKTVVGDDPRRLEDAFLSAISRSDLVISTGGLGPTRDDITRDVLAKALGLSMHLNNGILDRLKQRYRARGTKFQENSTRQAYVIENTEPIPNRPGAAPGTYLEKDGTVIVLLPGVPREMRYMMEHFVLERLRKQWSLSVPVSIMLNFAGIPESMIDQRLRKFDFSGRGMEFAILASLRRVQVILTGQDRDELKGMAALVKGEFPEAFYSEGDRFLEELILEQLKAAGKTLSVAESCTGGFLGKTLTDMPGSSAVFLGGFIVYQNKAKTRFLGVPEDVLADFGAVSSPVAERMATGVREAFGSDFGIGITGVAGPDASEEKPAGLVYISVNAGGQKEVREFHFAGTRDMVRVQSVTAALNRLRLLISRPKEGK
ncbi:MAG: competence/damage-inducible protein A [Acidobacteria bacterium]|nr:MAG: competence/damage-inducible protein A [Acidobacteriota bacterium]